MECGELVHKSSIKCRCWPGNERASGAGIKGRKTLWQNGDYNIHNSLGKGRKLRTRKTTEGVEKVVKRPTYLSLSGYYIK